MKLICNQSDLNNNLSLTVRAVPSRPTHPVLGNVLIVANADTNLVTLTAFDLALGIQTSFVAEIEESGRIVVNAKLLSDIISRLPEGSITLDTTLEEGAYENENTTLNIIPASGNYTLRAGSAEEFPELPEIEAEGSKEDTAPINLLAISLIEGIRGTLFATSSDETKQVLTGVHIKSYANLGILEFASTDGHRLSVVEWGGAATEQNLETTNKEIDLTIPGRALKELERMLTQTAKPDESVQLAFDSGQVAFEWQNQKLTSRVIDGQYPQYRQLIPKQYQREISLDRKQLLTILERVAVLADLKNNIVKFSIYAKTQELILSVASQDIGNAVETMPAQVSGEDIDIAFNIKYLVEGLKALPSSEIIMKGNSNLAPYIFTPLNGNLNMTYLAMPVQLRGG